MTPEAVIYRYLEVISGAQIDRELLARLVSADADLSGRWVRVLECDVDLDALTDALQRLPDDVLRPLAEAQAWAVVPGTGSARLSGAQWRATLHGACLADVLAGAGGRLRWPALLGISGVQIAGDPLLTELSAYRGVRPALLEDATPELRAFAVADALETHGQSRAVEVAAAVCDLSDEGFAAAVEQAEQDTTRLLAGLGLDTDLDADWGERLWTLQQLQRLATLLADARGSDARRAAHEQVARSLFDVVPVMMLVDAEEDALLAPGSLPCIKLHSPVSDLARVARELVPVVLDDGADTAVVDRQVLALLGADEALALPLGHEELLGVLVFAGEVLGNEHSARLYADVLARCWQQPATGGTAAALERYRERELQRLREIIHEANNPLSVVRNYLHILELRLQHEPTAVEQLELVSQEVQRAAEIFQRARDMTDPGAAEAGVGEARREPYDVNACLRRAVEVHRAYAEGRFVSLVAELCEGEVRIVGDENALFQVVANLIRNAIEAGRRGDQVTVESAVGIYRDGHGGVEVTVRDTGPGLPAEVLERLFEPKRTQKGGEHSGLGLHIAARLMHELGGSIDVRTTAGNGTSFVLFLPRDSD